MVFTLLGMGLRLFHLAEQSLWFDEILSVIFATLPLPDSFNAMMQEGLHHSPLYYLLLRPFASLGRHEFFYRFPSTWLGVLAIPLMWQLGRLIGGRERRNKVGVTAALLTTINPFLVWYAREARMYTLLALSAVGSFYFFLRLIRLAEGRPWVGIALFTSLGITSHHFAFYIPLVQFAYILSTFRSSYRLFRRWVLAQLVAFISLIPWMVLVIKRGEWYLSSANNTPPRLPDLWRTLWNFTLTYSGELTAIVWLALGLILGLLGYGLWRGLRDRPPEVELTVLWFMLPVTLTFLLSQRLPMYVDRYLILTLPPFLLLVSYGANRIPSSSVRRALLGGLVLAFGIGLGQVYFDRHNHVKEDWRSTAAYLETYGRPGDVVVAQYYQHLMPLNYYYHGSLERVSLITGKERQSLEGISNDHRRLWFVAPHAYDVAHHLGHPSAWYLSDLYATMSSPSNQTWLQSHQADIIETRHFAGLTLVLYQLTLP